MFKDTYKKANESIKANPTLINKILSSAPPKKKHLKIYPVLIAACLVIFISVSIPKSYNKQGISGAPPQLENSSEEKPFSGSGSESTATARAELNKAKDEALSEDSINSELHFYTAAAKELNSKLSAADVCADTEEIYPEAHLLIEKNTHRINLLEKKLNTHE